MLISKNKLQAVILGLMGVVAGIATYQNINKGLDGSTPDNDEPKPDAPKEDMQISPPPLPLPVKIPNLLTQPEVLNDTLPDVVIETPPPLPEPEIKKTPDEVKKAVENEVREIVASREVAYTPKKGGYKKQRIKETPPPLPKNKISNKKVKDYLPGSWSQRRKELGYSAKDSLTSNPRLLAEYNKWKASR